VPDVLSGSTQIVTDIPANPALLLPRPDLGRAGVLALMTPAENPTAEPELSVLLGPDINLLTTRMYSSDADLHARLTVYADRMAHWMAPFGSAPLDGAIFACTGSTYLAKPGLAPGKSLTYAKRDIPLAAAANAVHDAVTELGASKLVLVSPYPDSLTNAAVRWWKGQGYDIGTVLAVPPAAYGHPIYSREARAILDTLRMASRMDGDAVVALGTGAPSLPALAVASLETNRAILSSNLCSAWAASVSLGQASSPLDWLASDAPWRQRLQDRFPALMARLTRQDPA